MWAFGSRMKCWWVLATVTCRLTKVNSFTALTPSSVFYRHVAPTRGHAQHFILYHRPLHNTLLFSNKSPAQEMFSLIDTDNSGTICVEELGELLSSLNMDASEEEIAALFSHLDVDGSGCISFEEEFQPWYDSIVGETVRGRDTAQQLLQSRTTIHNFDATHTVSDDVLHRAIECAIAAPNHGRTEPWRFIRLGKETATQIADLNAKNIEDKKKANMKRERWASIPGWCVVTSKLNPTDEIVEKEDYAATCCAIQNFMLSMWAEGVGTKWTSGEITRTKQFAYLCGVHFEEEQVVGCIWYGFASNSADMDQPKRRRKNLEDVLTELP